MRLNLPLTRRYPLNRIELRWWVLAFVLAFGGSIRCNDDLPPQEPPGFRQLIEEKEPEPLGMKEFALYLVCGKEGQKRGFWCV